MIKQIQLSNGTMVRFNPQTNDGYEDILKFYEPKINSMVYSWKNVPIHDQEDLKQVCRIKLLEALKKFKTSKNINFSTYVYTVWHRKLFQIVSKYKAKKYSPYMEKDKHINYTHGMDKATSSYYLQVNKDKCPIKEKVIDCSTCKGCEHHVRYDDRVITKGFHEGEKKNFTMCKYFYEVLNKRGLKVKSLYSKIGDTENSLINILVCSKQSKLHDDKEFEIDLSKIEAFVSKKTFQSLRLLSMGMNKKEVMQKLKINRNELNAIIKSLSKNKKLKEILKKK